MYILCFFSGICSSQTAAANFNIAFGKTVTMSSTHGEGPGHYAVDGIRGGLWDQGCASTNKDKNPWMLIDLRGDYIVSEVYLRNRIDCCGKSGII